MPGKKQTSFKAILHSKYERETRVKNNTSITSKISTADNERKINPRLTSQFSKFREMILPMNPLFCSFSHLSSKLPRTSVTSPDSKNELPKNWFSLHDKNISIEIQRA